MTEKILAKAAEKSQVVPGDNIWVNVDVLMTHDVCGPGAFGIFKREFGEKAKVWDPEKIVVIPDHYIFTTDQRANRNVDIMREHCREQNIKYFYDITDLGDFRVLSLKFSSFLSFLVFLSYFPFMCCRLILTTKVSAMWRLHKKVIAGQER